MAKTDTDLFDRLRKSGLRKQVAKKTSDAIAAAPGGKAARKRAESVADDLRALANEIEDRAKGGPAKRKAAARKATATRKRKAAQRSAAAKKAAKTRADGRKKPSRAKAGSKR